jgi:hypothetical protein
MGNKKLRKLVSTAMKKRGFHEQLYRGNKRVCHRHLPAYRLKRLLFILSLEPGKSLINDCDGFNHRVMGYAPRRHNRANLRWKQKRHISIFEIDQLIREDGCYTCGCPGGPDDPWTNEQIFKYQRYSKDEIEEAKKEGWWHDHRQKIQDALEQGIPICDDDGILLQEFRRQY